MVVLGLSFDLGAVALTRAAVYRVHSDQAGIASALLNTAQQIGVAVGLALLAGAAATVTAEPGNASLGETEALVAGYSTALTVSVGLLLTATVVAFLTLTSTIERGEVPAVQEIH